MEFRHKVNGWVLDKQLKKFIQIVDIRYLQHQDDQVWLDYGAPSKDMYAITLDYVFTKATTAFLTVEDLEYHYPYIGIDLAAIEVLYGKSKV